MGATHFANVLSATRESINIDWDGLETAWALRAEQAEEERKVAMAKVVKVRDLACAMGRDRSHMREKIHRAGLEVFMVRDENTGQNVLAIDIEDVPTVKDFYVTTAHDIVDAKDVI